LATRDNYDDVVEWLAIVRLAAKDSKDCVAKLTTWFDVDQ
jgi:hypothetical protein